MNLSETSYYDTGVSDGCASNTVVNETLQEQGLASEILAPDIKPNPNSVNRDRVLPTCGGGV